MVISPATTTTLDFTIVSHATRLVLSTVRQASSTLSEMKSATLSGCPSPTDSEKKTKDLAMRGDAFTDGTSPAAAPASPNINVCRFRDASSRVARRERSGCAQRLLDTGFA